MINDPRMEVSSQHASITLNFWDVCLTDLGSTNGTEVIDRDGRRQRLAQNSTITIQPGTKIILAEVVEITFEVSE
ncbi:MAG: FHA domain-containing protein [Tetrasphaera sp.]|nr:FHA domain-containing protein [Tetrasphaera sp.]